MIGSFFKAIIKPKFVIMLIVLIFIASLLGVFIPQVSVNDPSYFEKWKLESPWTFYIVDLFQLNRVYTSVWFLLLVFIIMLSLGYSIYLQIKRNIKVHGSSFIVHGNDERLTMNNERLDEQIVRLMREKRYKLVQGSQFIVHSKEEVDSSQFTTEEIVHSSRFTVHGKDERSNEQLTINNEQLTMNNERVMVFSKNSINRWGSVIFHSGLFLLIVAGFIALSFQKSGFVKIIEGEVLSGIDSDFLTTEMGLFQERFDTGFKTQLLSFHHEYWDTEEVKQISSSIVLIDGENRYEGTVAPNRFVSHKGINIYQSNFFGYALTFVLKSPDGSETGIHFMLDRPDRKTKPFEGNIAFTGTPYIFDMKFYPDISKNSFHLGNPILHLQITKDSSQVHGSQFTVHGKDVNSEPRTVNRELIFDGLVIPGSVINIEDNLLWFANISHWSGLFYVSSIDMAIAYIGFFISCIGAAIIFFLPHKEIFVLRKGSVLSLYGRTNRYKPIFEEEMEEIKKFIVHS